MENLKSFLESQQSQYSLKIVYTEFCFDLSNSGRRGESKEFFLTKESVCSAIQNILENISNFPEEYDETRWRNGADKYFSDNRAKSLCGTQTRPFFEMINKLISWSTNSKLDEGHIKLTKENLKLTALTLKNGNFDKKDFFQKIFFGSPGTGKSHKVKELVGNQNEFRTTIHPDYDYAQFVGSYKPVKKKFSDNGSLSKEELLSQLTKIKEDKTNAYPIHKFSALYCESLKKLSKDDQISIVKESGSPDSMMTELAKGMAVGEFLQTKGLDYSSISYSFVPQVFANAYVAAWEKWNDDTKEPVYLVIEEINRGNCAQIFGDIFQLLDRKDGWSEYPIDVDSDFAEHIREKMGPNFQKYREAICERLDDKSTTENIKDCDFCKIALPPNLNILATMNTSDQSLFPMDSAFKRRFDWEYVPIDYGKEDADFTIELDDTHSYKWLDFLKKVNADIYKTTDSEDKQMGEFFIKPKKGNTIDLNTFRSKVLFYLWDSVYKDETEKKNIFHFKYPDDNGDPVTFQSLFESNEKAVGIIGKIMEKLEVKSEDRSTPKPESPLTTESQAAPSEP